MSHNDKPSDAEEPARPELQLEYALKLYDDSLARYRALDTKAARSLPTYALILALTGFLPTQLDPFALPVHLLCIVGSVFGVFSAVAGMAFLVHAMGTQPTAALPNDQKTRRAFRSSSVSRLSRDVAERACHAACKVDQESDKKARYVRCGLRLWIPTMALILLSVLLMATLGQLPPTATAATKHPQPKELLTVTENGQRNDNPDDPGTTNNEPEQPADQDTDDGNVVGPVRYVSESREHPDIPTADNDDDDR